MNARGAEWRIGVRCTLAIAAAAALNVWRVDLVNGAEFRLGPFLVMPLVLLLPPVWATFAALVAITPAVVLQHQPFIVLFVGLEALWLATFGRRWRAPVVADILYWCAAGLPVGLWVYGQLEAGPIDYVLVRLANLAVNSIAAVLVADFMTRSTPLPQWLGLGQAPAIGLRGMIFNAVFTMAALPLVLVAFAVSLMLRSSAAERGQSHLRQAILEVTREVEAQVEQHQAAVATAARLIEQRPELATLVIEETRRSHPAVITMLATDAAGRITQVSPAMPNLLGASVADRAYFRAARDRGAPVVSEVFRGRGFGTDILIAAAAPVSAGGQFAGVVEASLEVRRFAMAIARRGLPSEVAVLVVDAAGRVIVAGAATGLRPLDRISNSELTRAVSAPAGTSLPLNLMVDGQPRRVDALAAHATFGMTVIAVRPAYIDLQQLLWMYLMVVIIGAAALACAMALARSASRRIALPLEHFARDAVDQAESGAITEMRLPAGRPPREIAMVFTAFNCLVSRIRETHAALVRTNVELDARVAERTKELAAARARAEAASRSKTEFVAMTGHEIRTPLNAILGLTDSLADDLRTGPAATRIQTIRRAGQRLLAVVNDLLDLSRVEAGRLELQPSPTELASVAREVGALFSAQAARKGVALEIASPTAPALWVDCDGARLQQVLVNLVGNALKFTAVGRVQLHLDVAAGEPEWVTVRFAVRDSGPGIAPEAQARLFQPYVQIAGMDSQGIAGTGLGLAISRRLVELMGGTLQVASAPGQGAEFFFVLTCRRAGPPAGAVAARAPAAAAIDTLRVLVVDDNLANREVLRAFLEGKCAAVACAESAAEGLQRLRTEPFDVALVDLEMPEESGDAVARAMVAERARMASSRCALIAVSAHSREDKRDECLRWGFDDFLSKPVDRQELFRNLPRWAAAAAVVEM